MPAGQKDEFYDECAGRSLEWGNNRFSPDGDAVIAGKPAPKPCGAPPWRRTRHRQQAER